MVEPSGDASSEIHVPSSVVKRTARVGFACAREVPCGKATARRTSGMRRECIRGAATVSGVRARRRVDVRGATHGRCAETKAGATSPCRAGTFVCSGGIQTCQGSVGPSSSVDACGVDSNCDGMLTGQPNFQTDVANCGSCGNNCYAGAVHSVWSCVMGMCMYQGCETGYYDLDNNRTCEYSCNFRSASEACNAQDDNCNGQIDEMVTPPTPSQVCGVSGGNMRPECTTQVTVACVSGAWQCTFPGGVCPGGCSANDEVCDTLDNDCDGQVNENVPNYNLPCASDDANPGTQGICRTTGNYVCSGANSTVCNAVPNTAMVGPELCDGLDNDCDSLVDEVYTNKGSNMTYYVKPNVTKVGYSYLNTAGTTVTGNLWMYSYEASRPRATATSAGTGNGYHSSTGVPAGTTLDRTRACSEPGRVPWFNVTPLEVEQTCNAMGGTICSTQDWIGACKVADPTITAANHCNYGYAPRANCTSGYTTSKYCNIQPYDFNSMITGDQDGLLPTGYIGAAMPFLQNCWADWSNLQGNTAATNKIFDLTGNLREITRSATSTYPLMGGASAADQSGSTCNFTFYTTNANTFQLYDLGFRCCFTTNPG